MKIKISLATIILGLSILSIDIGVGQKKGEIYLAKVDGVINPITEQFLCKAIKKAVENEAECLIIEMDTPGGLEQSMHNIVKKILNSNIPIITFVSPKGARAASAGALIALASDVIAMAPSTHIGAAHPVNIGGEKMDKVMAEKITNDMSAFVKSIAEKKGRNVEWAISAVKESASITEEEALKENVIELIAENIPNLLKKLDGWKIKKENKEFILHTKGAKAKPIKMNFREKFLHAIADPNIAYILLMIGIYGLIYEFSAPGIGLGAVAGSICLILAFFGLQNLPINLAGLFLIIIGIILLVLEAFATSHGILAIGGIAALTFGSFMLIDTASAPFLAISWKLIASIVGGSAIFFIFVIGAVIRDRRRKVTTGIQGIIGATGHAQSRIAFEGQIFAQGELWEAISEEVIEKGEKVVIIEMLDGLKLKVKRL